MVLLQQCMIFRSTDTIYLGKPVSFIGGSTSERFDGDYLSFHCTGQPQNLGIEGGYGNEIIDGGNGNGVFYGGGLKRKNHLTIFCKKCFNINVVHSGGCSPRHNIIDPYQGREHCPGRSCLS